MAINQQPQAPKLAKSTSFHRLGSGFQAVPILELGVREKCDKKFVLQMRYLQFTWCRGTKAMKAVECSSKLLMLDVANSSSVTAIFDKGI